ncbi:MAG: hypothetical protein IPK52_22465 [Chloroflexi bacterium]|nr:hypothetical protein [Chloroflexota bacterium]
MAWQHGANTAAYKIAPDIAIALDVGFARRPVWMPDVSGDFNAGPLIGIGPNFHEKLNARLRDTAKCEIKIQDDPLPGRGNDAWPIQINVAGIPGAAQPTAAWYALAKPNRRPARR